MTKACSIHYHEDVEDQGIYYAYYLVLPENPLTPHIDQYRVYLYRVKLDKEWKFIDKKSDPRGWEYCYSNLFRGSKSSEVSEADILQAGVPLLDPPRGP